MTVEVAPGTAGTGTGVMSLSILGWGASGASGGVGRVSRPKLG